MKINWFSRLPPETGPAASLTGRLAPSLAELAEPRLFAPRPGWDPGLEAVGPVAVARPGYLSWSLVNQAEASVFVLDDDAESTPLWMLSRRHRGIVVLTSPSLEALWRGIPDDAAEDREEVSAFLRARSGLDAPESVARFWRGEAATDLGAGVVEAVAARALSVVMAHDGAAGYASRGDVATIDPRGPAEAAASFFVALAARAASMRAALAADAMLDRAAREIVSWHGAEAGAVPRAAESHIAALRSGLREAVQRLPARRRRPS